MHDYKTPIRKFIEDNFMMGSQGADFGDGDSFMRKHIIDSTGFLELVLFLEETWGVTVDDDEMVPENLDSLENLQGYLTRKVAA